MEGFLGTNDPCVSWKDPLDPRSLRFLWIRFLQTTFFLSGGSNKICNVFEDSQPTLSPSLTFAFHAVDDGAQVPVDSLAVGVCSLSLNVPCTQKEAKITDLTDLYNMNSPPIVLQNATTCSHVFKTVITTYLAE